jgi:hypothetical protein
LGPGCNPPAYTTFEEMIARGVLPEELADLPDYRHQET